jgi:hypothetical protein
VLRLWNRVGPFRALAVLLLIAAVATGASVAADRQTQQLPTNVRRTAVLDREEILDLAAEQRRAAAADRAGRKEAERKAGSASIGAPVTKATPSPSASAPPPAAPAPPRLPVPTSCSQYTGNRGIGCAVLLSVGFKLDQMPCLEKLWTKESGWNVYSTNRSSGAYGIPQALPGSKMASAGADWRTNPETQVRWGLSYIKGRYGTPCGAWGFFQGHNWY